jgi:hypothetical protein
MPPLPQRAPDPIPQEEKVLPKIHAANEDFFGRDICIETLNEEDTQNLFKKRKAIEWMVHNRTDVASQELYKNEQARIREEMKRYNLSESDYEHFLTDEGIMVD